MGRLRSLSTSFWSDPFIEELTPSQKLLFIYLITNEKTNMLGIYESSIKKISFETGIKRDDVLSAIKTFEKFGKVKYENNYIILVNYMKHQKYNTNMKKSAIDDYNNLPNSLKINDLIIEKSNPSEAFETLSNHYGMVRKIEVEVESEIEVEEELNFKVFLNLFNSLTNKNTKTIPDKARRQISARVKEGYTVDDFSKAITNCYNDPFHKENRHKYLTIEFISRADKLDKFLNMTSAKELSFADKVGGKV